MNDIRIYHAFDGFLYAPLFVASEMNYFPKGTEPVYIKGGDRATIDALQSPANRRDYLNFAICDPFSCDITKPAPLVQDRICIVGSLISRLPVWVYNRNKAVTSVAHENDIERHAAIIRKVVIYKEGTTGHLIGRRVLNILRDKNFGVELSVKEFGEEFDPDPDDQTIVVTSDVLRFITGVDDHDVIFSYADNKDGEFVPYFFTGVLTLESLVENRLVTVMRVLAGLKDAIDVLKRVADKGSGDEYVQVMNILRKKYAASLNALGVTGMPHQNSLMRRSLQYMMSVPIYDPGFPRSDVAAWDKAWSNAAAPWKKDSQVPHHEDASLLPALLFKDKWETHLEDHFAARFDRGKSELPEVVSPTSPPLVAGSSRFISFITTFTFLLSVAAFTYTILYYTESLPKPTDKSDIRKVFAGVVGIDLCCVVMLWSLLQIIHGTRLKRSGLADPVSWVGVWWTILVAIVGIFFTCFV